MLPIFALGSPITGNSVPRTFIGERPHETVADATVLEFELPAGSVLLTMWHGELHEIVYQTPRRFIWNRWWKNRTLFRAYDPGAGWRRILDNGFGMTYRSNDDQLFALWSYVMDINTVGTMQFLASLYPDIV